MTNIFKKTSSDKHKRWGGGFVIILLLNGKVGYDVQAFS